MCSAHLIAAVLLLHVFTCRGDDELPVLNGLLASKVFNFSTTLSVKGVTAEVAGNISSIYLPKEGLRVVRSGDHLNLLLNLNLHSYVAYRVKEGKYLGEKGTANLTAELQYTATLDTSNRTDVKYESCKAHLKLPEFKLTGMAELLRLEILEYLKIEIPKELCKAEVPSLLSSSISKELDSLDAFSVMPLPNVEQVNRDQEAQFAHRGLLQYNKSALVTINRVLQSVFDVHVPGTPLTALGTVLDEQDIWEPYFPNQPQGFPSSLSIGLHDSYTKGDLTVDMLYLSIEGLDTVGGLTLDPLTANSILFNVNFTEVNISIAANVSIGQAHSVVTFEVSKLRDFGILASVLMPVSAQRMGAMSLMDLVSKDIGCVLYPLVAFNITALSVSPSSISAIKEQGLLQGELQPSINTLLATMLGTFTPDVFEALPAIFQYKLLPAINREAMALLSPYLNATANPCKKEATHNIKEGLVSLNSSTALNALQWVFNDFIGVTNQINLNNITHALMDGAANLSSSMGARVLEFSVNVSNISVGGLDTFTTLDLLTAKTDYTMQNALKFSPRLGFDLALDFSAMAQQPFSGLVHMDVYLPGFFVNVTTMTKVVKSLLGGVPVGKVVSPSCLLSTLAPEGLAVPAFNGSVDKVLVTLTILEQQGLPMLQQFEADLLKPEAIEQLTNSLNVFLNHDMNVIMNRNATTQQLNNIAAKSSCAEEPHTPSPTAADKVVLTQTDCYIMVFGTVSVFAFMLLVIYVYRRHKNEKGNEATPLMSVNEEEKHVTPSLMMHPSIPVYVRYGMPVLLCCIICLFFAGNIGLGARVRATTHLAGNEVQLDDVFSYDLVSTISDMWNGDAYLLSVLIASFSGIWPYIKLLFLLFTWCSPSSVLSTPTRGYILRVIDILGKWSLIDDFMIVILMVAFRLHFKSPEDWTFMPEGFLGLDLYVVPRFGMYAFLSAAISTLVLNHVQIAYHRSAMEHDQGFEKGWFELGANDNTKRVLCLFTDDCQADNTNNKKGNRVTFTRKVTAWGITFLLVFTIALLVWGCTVDAFRFEFEGLAAYALDITSPGAQMTQHSVFSLTSLISQASTPGDYIGYAYIMVTFVTFSFFTPVLSMLLLILLWTAPLKLKHQKMLFFLNEMVAAWSAIEVFILALMASLFELPQFAQFMIGHKCDVINDYTRALMGPLDLNNSKCFDVSSTLLDGCWLLFSAAILSNFTFQVTWYAAEHMIKKVERHTTDEEVQVNGEP